MAEGAGAPEPVLEFRTHSRIPDREKWTLSRKMGSKSPQPPDFKANILRGFVFLVFDITY
jgi:hypothetical protein